MIGPSSNTADALAHMQRAFAKGNFRRAAALTRMHLKMRSWRAYRLRLALREIYNQPSKDWDVLILDRCKSIRSDLAPMKKAACSCKHRDGILRWSNAKIANASIEGINGLVRAAEAKARCYRSPRNRIAITHLIR